MVAPVIIAAGISAAASLLSKGGGGTAPAGPSNATGGFIGPGTWDHSGWNVQIGSGLNVAPGSLLPMLALAAGLFLVATRWRPKP